MHIRVYQGLVDKVDITFGFRIYRTLEYDYAASTKPLDEIPEYACLAAPHLRLASAPIAAGTLISLQADKTRYHMNLDVNTSQLHQLSSGCHI